MKPPYPVTAVHQYASDGFGILIQKCQKTFDVMDSRPGGELDLEGHEPAAMLDNEVHFFAVCRPPVMEGCSGRHILAETAEVVADQCLKIATQFAAPAKAFGIVVTGDKDGQCRIHIKDFRGFDQSPGTVDAVRRYPSDNIGYFKEFDISVRGGVTYPAVFCHVGLVEDVSCAQRQTLHDPPEIDEGIDLGHIPQIPFKISTDISFQPVEHLAVMRRFHKGGA